MSYLRHIPKENNPLIEQLKSRIYELENLSINYSLLQQELNTIKREKTHSEYETQDEMQKRQINQLKAENKILQINLNEKKLLNEQLYAYNEELIKKTNDMNIQISQLTSKLTDALKKIEIVDKENNILRQKNIELNSNISNLRVEINTLYKDKQNLNKLCKEKDYSIIQYEEDKKQLLIQIDEVKNEVNFVKEKIKSNEGKNALINKKMQQDAKDSEVVYIGKYDKDIKILNKQKDEYIINKDELNEQLKQNIQLKKDNNLLSYDNEILLRENTQLKNDNEYLKKKIIDIISKNAAIEEFRISKNKISNVLKRNKIKIENSSRRLNTDNTTYSYNSDYNNNNEI